MKVSIEVTDEKKIKMEMSDDADPITMARLLIDGASRLLSTLQVKEESKIIKPKIIGI